MLAIDLSGRIALVTASSRGIGRAIAVYLARAGAKVVVTWAADRAAGEDAVAEIARAGGTAMLEHLDVTDSAEVDAVVARAVKQWGKVDVLVSNAGVGTAVPITETTDAEYARCRAAVLEFLYARHRVPARAAA